MASLAAPTVTSSAASGSQSRTDLHRAVKLQLEQSPYRALRLVGCQIHNGTAILTGRVRSYFLKQMAQHLVGQMRGIERVKNELSVA